MLSPSKTLLGILGFPLSHTLSPVLHKHLLAQLSMVGEYTVYETPSEDLACKIDSLQSTGLTGLNVTIPHKVDVMPSLTQLTPAAELMGAVNTIRFEENGNRLGHNTDGEGFFKSLPNPVKETLPRTHTLILGAGGSARAVVTALAKHHTQHITLALRNLNKQADWQTLISQYQRVLGSPTQFSFVQWEPGLPLANLETYTLVVNTTPIGMYPNENASPLAEDQLQTLPKNSFIYDLIYRPLETTLLKQAKSNHLAHQNGLDMLLYQGIAAFEFWTGKTIPSSVIASAREQLLTNL